MAFIAEPRKKKGKFCLRKQKRRKKSGKYIYRKQIMRKREGKKGKIHKYKQRDRLE